MYTHKQKKEKKKRRASPVLGSWTQGPTATLQAEDSSDKGLGVLGLRIIFNTVTQVCVFLFSPPKFVFHLL